MVQAYHYVNATGTSTFDVSLGNVVRLGTITQLTQQANLLDPGQSSITFDDPNANLGHSGDAILGLQSFLLTESDEAVGFRTQYAGLIKDRIYSRGDSDRPSLITSTARQITCNLTDLNSIASDRIIYQTDGNRPAETVAARLTWLLASSYATLIHDNGFVDYPTTPVMDANDYRGQYPGDVLGDCALAVKYNVFIYWDDTHGQAALWFKDSDTSTAYTSTLSLSGVLADLSPTNSPFATVWGVTDAVLNRSPDHTYAGVYYPYANGALFNSRASTGDTYRWRDGVAPNANAKTLARAENDVTLLLAQSASEEDRITTSVELPSNLVGHIQAGMRIQFKAPWLPGYESYVWCRILRRTLIQTVKDQLTYTLDLELSPQTQPAPALSCATAISGATSYASGAFNTGCLNWATGPLSQAIALSPSAASVIFAVTGAIQCSFEPGPFTSAVAPYTLLGAGSDSDGAAGYRANTTAGGTFAANFTGGDVAWQATIAAALRTTAAAPVQTAHNNTGSTLTLGATPTVGNVLVTVAYAIREVPGTPTGWTTLVSDRSLLDVSGVSGVGLLICARCVQAGDTTTVNVPNGSFGHSNYVSEWAIT